MSTRDLVDELSRKGIDATKAERHAEAADYALACIELISESDEYSPDEKKAELAMLTVIHKVSVMQAEAQVASAA